MIAVGLEPDTLIIKLLDKVVGLEPHTLTSWSLETGSKLIII